MKLPKLQKMGTGGKVITTINIVLLLLVLAIIAFNYFSN
jgi:hypothetical protein